MYDQTVKRIAEKVEDEAIAVTSYHYKININNNFRQMAEEESKGKTDYYELLGVSETADAAELKKGYRKAALKWHPDKNPDNLDTATEMIKAINEAYETLNDPNERAWYDSHKNEILTGEKDSGIDLFQYFSYTAYPGGISDEPDGFYSVYREVFTKINVYENSQAEEKSQVFDRVIFGDSTTNPEDVKAFYEYWTDFVSIATFAYADVYKPGEYGERYIRRAATKENAAERKKARKEFMEQVRRLADYCKKRDPRWQEYVKQVREEKERKQKEKEEAKAKQLEIMKKEMEEARARERERYTQEAINGEDVNEFYEEEKDLDLIYCEYCNKTFKNERSWENHKNSKKHKQNVARLAPKEAPPPPPKPTTAQNKKGKKQQEDNPYNQNFNEAPDLPQKNKQKIKNKNDFDYEEPEEDTRTNRRKQKAAEKNNRRGQQNDFAFEEPQQDTKKNRRRAKQAEKNQRQAEMNDFEEQKNSSDEEPEENTKINRRQQKAQEKNQRKGQQQGKAAPEEEKKMGKAKLKRMKKNAQEKDMPFQCNKCKAKFESNGKLHKHLKDSGHSAAN